MRQNTIFFLTVLGLGVWFFSKPVASTSNPNRAIASQFEDDDDGGEEYDFHESVGVKKSFDAKPNPKAKSKNLKQPSRKDPSINTPNKVEDLLEDSEFSKLDVERLIKLCQFGDRQACHQGGLKMFSADRKSVQAAKLLARGCSLKNYDDCEAVGEILKSSQGPYRALPYYKAACEQAGLANSCFETAVIMSQRPQLSPTESEKTKEYFNIACLEGNAKGCLSLAGYYANNWTKHQYYMTVACRIDATLDSRECQQLVN